MTVGNDPMCRSVRTVYRHVTVGADSICPKRPVCGVCQLRVVRTKFTNNRRERFAVTKIRDFDGYRMGVVTQIRDLDNTPTPCVAFRRPVINV